MSALPIQIPTRPRSRRPDRRRQAGGSVRRVALPRRRPPRRIPRRTRASSGFQEISVDLIEPSPYQARREIPGGELAELAESIRSEGLLQPVVVRAHGEHFQLIAGERRWRAFQQLKIKAIPARLVEASDASAAAIGLIENLQRADLNPIEEAQGYASLHPRFRPDAGNRRRTGGARAARRSPTPCACWRSTPRSRAISARTC